MLCLVTIDEPLMSCGGHRSHVDERISLMQVKSVGRSAKYCRADQKTPRSRSFREDRVAAARHHVAPSCL